MVLKKRIFDNVEEKILGPEEENVSQCGGKNIRYLLRIVFKFVACLVVIWKFSFQSLSLNLKLLKVATGEGGLGRGERAGQEALNIHLNSCC